MSIGTCGSVRYALLLVLVTAAVAGFAYSDTDPVVEYYWSKARAAFDAHDPAVLDLRYKLSTQTFFKHIDRRGEVVRIDSAMVDYYCTGDKVDSQKTISGDNSRFRELDLTFTNVLNLSYRRYSFPNDTGGIDLALGFHPDSGGTDPDGLIVIDRNRYLPRWLYLHYPAREGYKRFTRSFRFREVGGCVFPDSIWEVGSRWGIFSDENYRLETGIFNVEIEP